MTPEGRPLHRIGGPGEGPGEFSSRVAQPLLYGIMGDTLWVTDQGSARFTQFSLDGNVLGTTPLEGVTLEAAPGVALTHRPAVPLGSAQFASTYTIGGGSMSAIASSPTPIMAPILRMRSDGAVVDSLALAEVRGSSPDALQVLGQRLPVPQSPDEREMHLIDSRGILTVEREASATANGVVALSHVRLSGDTLLDLSLNYAAKPWSPEGVSLLMAAPLRIWSNRVGEGADTSVAAAALRETIKLPSYQVPVSAVRFAADDRVWLHRENEPSLPREVVVIDPADGPLGVVTVPEGVEVLWSSGTTVWASVTDELDVPWLVRYRLSR